jgi:hypothetical protein
VVSPTSKSSIKGLSDIYKQSQWGHSQVAKGVVTLRCYIRATMAASRKVQNEIS